MKFGSIVDYSNTHPRRPKEVKDRGRFFHEPEHGCLSFRVQPTLVEKIINVAQGNDS